MGVEFNVQEESLMGEGGKGGGDAEAFLLGTTDSLEVGLSGESL